MKITVELEKDDNLEDVLEVFSKMDIPYTCFNVDGLGNKFVAEYDSEAWTGITEEQELLKKKLKEDVKDEKPKKPKKKKIPVKEEETKQPAEKPRFAEGRGRGVRMLEGDKEQVLKLHTDKLFISDIAEKTGWSEKSVWKLLREHGLKPNKRKKERKQDLSTPKEEFNGVTNGVTKEESKTHPHLEKLEEIGGVSRGAIVGLIRHSISSGGLSTYDVQNVVLDDMKALEVVRYVGNNAKLILKELKIMAKAKYDPTNETITWRL